ncbi:MAG TPA: cytochrome C [Candidatus Paceibacterota bacterium]|nr:cytochrome C [Verrucomicrobiota bacterium]HRZ45486.1 cytochrome C [Candidatus Paceibacterota bacterium]HRZ92588.1 cytochrome C [Candidatus Paceibacterota bacterium]
MKAITVTATLGAVLLAGTIIGFLAQADEFTKKDQERWQNEYMAVVQKGRALWTSAELGTKGVACAQCHPNAANTHPETYPKFQQQLGRVIALREMINWCIQQPLEGKPLAFDDPKMIALESYIAYERRGVRMDPGKH